MKVLNDKIKFFRKKGNCLWTNNIDNTDVDPLLQGQTILPEFIGIDFVAFIIIDVFYQWYWK